MFDEYRKEMREQGKSIRGLARYMGKSESSLTKKFTGVNSFRVDEVYGAMEYINKPLYELPKYFPRYEV